MIELAKHPAQYSAAIVDVMKQVTQNLNGVALDPFAGVGGVHKLQHPGLTTYGIELEQEWASQHPATLHGDATRLPFTDRSIDAIVTSPVYGNRMSDSHNAKERCKNCAEEGCEKCDFTGRRSYKRLTYTHTLGRSLHTNNAGRLQWGKNYTDLHSKAWTECARVLRKNGTFVLNVSDHIRAGKVIPVTDWHVTKLSCLGIEWRERIAIRTPRMRYGQNGQARVGYESVYVGVMQ